MSKKIIIGLAAIVVLGGGGFFYVNSVNSKVENQVKQELDSSNIKHGTISYSMFSNTLTIDNISYPYKDDSIIMENTADKVIIKGINKDYLLSTDENPVICDELSFNNIKNVISTNTNSEPSKTPTNNPELIVAIESTTFTKPTLNFRELANLHKNNPFSEKYFEALLKFSHNGINFNNIKVEAPKGKVNQAVFTIGEMNIAPTKNENTNLSYKNITIGSQPINITIGSFDLEELKLPSAKYLANLNKISLRLNQLSNEFETNPSAIHEYEELSDQMLNELTTLTTIPFTSVKLADTKIYINELTEVKDSPITLDNLTVTFNETDKLAKLTSTLENLFFSSTYLKLAEAPKEVLNSLPDGVSATFTNARSFDKETGSFTDDSKVTITKLATITSFADGKILSKNLAKFLFAASLNELYNNSFSGIEEDIVINKFTFSYLDDGLMNLMFALAESEFGLKKEQLKELAKSEVTQSSNDIINAINMPEKNKTEIAALFKSIISFLDSGKFNFAITFNKEYTIKELLEMSESPDFTISSSAN